MRERHCTVGKRPSVATFGVRNPGVFVSRWPLRGRSLCPYAYPVRGNRLPSVTPQSRALAGPPGHGPSPTRGARHFGRTPIPQRILRLLPAHPTYENTDRYDKYNPHPRGTMGRDRRLYSCCGITTDQQPSTNSRSIERGRMPWWAPEELDLSATASLLPSQRFYRQPRGKGALGAK
jgi:hypothetical protein